MSASVLVTQIERIVYPPSWRGTRYATFQRSDGWFICEAYFEGTEPHMQIRSSAHSLEEAAIVATGIHMASEWLAEQIASGGNIPQKKIEQ